MIKPKDCVSKVAKISRIKKVQKTDYSRCPPKKLKILEQDFQQKAILTNDWYYYAGLLGQAVKYNSPKKGFQHLL